jgi:uncharacterized metal-binding protein
VKPANAADIDASAPDSNRERAPSVNALLALACESAFDSFAIAQWKSMIMNSDHSNPPFPRKPGTVVYACSGCSDAGEIADRVARQLSLDGVARMSCLAGIGGRVKSLISTAERAEHILVVDGCPLNCARKTLELAGFNHLLHLELHTLGIRKGSAPVTTQRIAAGVEAARRILAIKTCRLHRNALTRVIPWFDKK